VPLGPERTLDVTPTEGGAHLRLRSARPGEAMELELRFEAGGTTVRLSTPAVELVSSGRISATCEEFAVQASRSIDLRSEGTIHQRAAGAHAIEAEELSVDASPGAVRLRANDDVQLLGEQILLNCERQPPMPAWVGAGREQPASLPPAAATGDPDVLAEMLDDER
ncbi:MAG: hypothetical protein KDK70_31530, partial [Myxococcales bacterium]|nr:hypothetical protein [Myxococcales bacterium]